MKQVNTKEDFLSVQLSDISQVYNGKRDCCRCGCKGNYISTSFMKGDNNVVDDKLVENRLKKAKELVKQGAEFEAGGTYFDIKTGENRTMTFYFDDLK